MKPTLRALFAFALVLCASDAFAQADRATLTGVVKDATNALIPGATVTARNTATDVTSTAITDASGAYLIGGLIPGNYLVETELTGFKKATQSLTLETGQRARADFTLIVGAINETVTVAGTSPMLSTETATLGAVISQSEVAKLPLATRNWDDLLGMAAGVQGDRYTEQSGSTAAGRTGGANVHGARSLQNNFLLDGLDNNSISENVQELTTQVSRPSVDAIAEFKVVTSPYAAEYGRTPGAAISVTTKSGGNQFRGTAYEFLRNDGLNTIDYFTKRQAQQQGIKAVKPDYKQNNFGGNLGGPIVRSKAFFFGDFEATRLTQGVSRPTVVPTLNERRGIFATTVRDPLTGQPFQNNTIPEERWDPVSKQLMAMFPEPNASGANNFFRNANATDDAERYLARFDVHMGSNDNLFARYYYSDRDRFIPGNFGGIADGTSTSAWGRQNIKAHTFAAGWNRTIGSNRLNELRFGYNMADSSAVQDPFGQAPPFTIPGVVDDPRVNGGLPGVNFSTGGYRLGSPDFLPKYQLTDQVQLSNAFTWFRGSHNVKVGGDLQAPIRNTFLDVPAMRGSVTFRPNYTGNVLGDFLLGYVSDAQLSNLEEVHQEMWGYSFYAQDDWKPTQRLTLNLGVRYDFMTPALERDNRMSNFNRAAGTLVQASDGSVDDRGLVDADRNNFAPRAGVTFAITPRTITRGGFGIFYNLYDRIGSEDQLALNAPFLINNSVAVNAAQVATGAPLFFLKNGFPSTFLDPNDPTLLRRVRIRAINPEGQKAQYKQWSLGFQRELSQTIVVSADYVGTKGSDIWTLRNLNQPDPVTKLAPYPNLGGFIEYTDQDGTSKYDGLEVTFERRFSRGYGFRAAYTLSKATDNSGEHLFTGGSPSFLQNALDRNSWEGPSDQDTRHRFAGNWIFDLPFGEGRKWLSSGAGAKILGGFTYSGIVTARTGRPFTVTQSSNNVGQSMTGLPNRVGDGEGQKTVDAWFDVTAFQAVTSGTFGNSGRNILRGPGLVNVDTALDRRFTFAGGRSFAVRWEVFNLFNTVQLGLPNSNISDNARGTISRLAGDPRVMQLAFRLMF
jgi:outer membrane receptor protein involved in Fe transport